TSAYTPAITTLRVLNSSGTPVSKIKTGDMGKISFSVRSSSFNSIDTSATKLFLKKNGTTEWEEVNIGKRTNDSYLGVINVASIGKYANMDSALIDIKIVTQNKDKNKIEWALEPAFVVGNYTYTAVEEKKDTYSAIPKEFTLYNNFPNPFNPTTTISYSIPKQSHVELKVYDMLGREVTTLIDKEQNAGEYKVKFNASSLPSGIYVYTIQAGQFRDAKKLMLLK
ncbi:MAG: T9SS type A sorting domain-containing protein, partial [Bacteroidota bacterium]|nr:T9SS type A sorting domain-containing protein [Bacteroidota bacterium]